MRIESFKQAAARNDASLSKAAAGGATQKVLYVLGFARSGTTVLGNLLGEINGLMHVGELFYLWKRLVAARGSRCGCGSAVTDCAFWAPVVKAALEDVWPSSVLGVSQSQDSYATQQRLLLRQAYDAQCRATGTLGVARALLARVAPGFGDTSQYTRVTQALYCRAAQAAGARVLVDTSKLSMPAFHLRCMSRIDPYFIHIVRDPRGTTLSRQRKRAPIVHGCIRLKTTTMIADSLRWVRDNATAEIFCRTLAADRHMSLTYEQFVAAPESTLRGIARFVGEEHSAFPFLEGSSAVLGSHHTVRGNRNRFRTGRITLQADDAWHSLLRARDKIAITALTSPALLRYRYSLGSRTTIFRDVLP